jgi:hypothetical protein
MNNEFISIKRVVERLLSNHPFADYEVNWSDVAETTGQILKLYGIPQYYITKHANITIEDGRGELPTGYLYFDSFEHKCIPLVYTGDPMFKKLHTENCCNIITPGNANGQSDTFKGIPPVLSINKETYTINDHYIFTSFTEGTVQCAYEAIPTDEEGYPMIPNNEQFLRALEWELAGKIAYKLYISDKLSNDKYKEIQRNRAVYKSIAIGEHRIPDKDRLEYWLKSFRLTLIPNNDFHRNKFRYTEQQIINHPNQGYNQFNQGVQY